MPRSKEEKAAYNKQWYIDNAEKVKQRGKQYYIDNAENTKQRGKQYRIDNYAKYKKTNTISCWKKRGMIGDLSFIYDYAYNTAYECWCCKKAFKSTRDRHCDHNHDTGAFRQILCNACNHYDNWQKI